MKKTQIVSTKEYKKFTVDDSNRGITTKNLKKLRQSMTTFGWLEAYPMHVVSRAGRMVVIDGQHRFAIAQELGIPVLYVVCKDYEDLHIAEINNAQSPWSIKDYLESHIKRGTPHYAALRNFSEEYRLPLGISSKLLMGLSNRQNGSTEIKEGKFRVKDSATAGIIGRIISFLRAELGIKWAANCFFVDALVKCTRVEGFSAETFVKRCASCPGKLVLQPTTKAFLQMIEDVYNRGAAKKNTLPLAFKASQN
jgi:hypothetical protein